MSKILLSFFIILLFSSNLIANQTGEIKVDLNNTKVGALEKPLVGMFMEYIYGRVNSKYGVSAEELQDRGFDAEKYGMDWELYQYWEFYNTCNKDSILEAKPWYSGYNQRGLRHYLILRTAEIGESGFRQNVILDSAKTFDFYIFLKGTVDSAYLRITSLEDNKVLFDQSLGSIPVYWEKRTAVIPPLPKQTHVEVLIYTKSKGEINFDESSLMARDNKYNLRKEFFELMKGLNCKILRFPGGCFADYTTWHFDEHIGDKNQRISPNYWFDVSIQRMDFSLDEYFAFCKELNIEPYLVFNVGNGTVEEAVNLLEYCNGPVNTKFGKKRAENGHPEPYNVIYFEVGNEQWEGFNPLYPQKYLEFYKALKSYDPKIKLMVDGYHWAGTKDLDRVFSVVQADAEYYSWHPAAISYQDNNIPPEEEYWGMASWGIISQFDIDWITKGLKEKSGPKTMNAPTEYWVAFDKAFSDTSVKSRSLVGALAEMNFLHTFLRNYETTGPACRTLFVGMLVADSTSKKERIFYGSPGFNGYGMCYNNLGKDFVPSTYTGSSFTLPSFKLMNFVNNVPLLDVLTTKSKDTLFISVINRHISESVVTQLKIPQWKKEKKVKVLELYSPNFLDCNSADKPYNIAPKLKDTLIKSQYIFPPHSYTIIAIPLSDIVISVNEEPVVKVDFNILPNPSSDEILFDAYGKMIDYIRIYNVLGNEVKVLSEISRGFVEINIQDLPIGSYYLNASIEGKQVKGSFLKE
jgi:alpha-N-arabinofuranosidase